MQTETLVLIVSAVAGLLLLSLLAWYTVRFLNSQRLRRKFGSEYDYAIEKIGSQQKAEEALVERQKRIDEMNIRPLQLAEWERYRSEWVGIQAEFVDDPEGAVEKADRLVTEIMILRGFSMADFEQRAEDFSVFYPELVSDYRAAHEIVEESQDGGASTEELRHAMVQYRDVVEVLMRTEYIRSKENESDRVPA